MFHVAQWSEDLVEASPSLDCIPLWAHLHNVPFNLIHQQGLSHIAGQIGEPIETDDWTVNLTSISSAHVKVEVNTSKVLPTMLEVERENGSICMVNVEYPWIPPTCSQCKEVGHIAKNWLHLPPPPVTTVPTTTKATSSKAASASVCFNCKDQGHLMRNCPKPSQQWTPVLSKQMRKDATTFIVGSQTVIGPESLSTVKDLVDVSSPALGTADIAPQISTTPSNISTPLLVLNSDVSSSISVVNMKLDSFPPPPASQHNVIIKPPALVDPSSPSSPMDIVHDCVLGHQAVCPSKSVVVKSSTLAFVSPKLNLNPSNFNPFKDSSQKKALNRDLLPAITAQTSHTKSLSYLDKTKEKPHPPPLPLFSTTLTPLLASPNSQSFTLITSNPSLSPISCFESPLQSMEVDLPKPQ